ncbi:MAG: hypothetical protein ACK5LC_14985 [Coprobacillaceae bacterium]
MPNLITQKVYEETLDYIEGRKEKPPLLKELTLWYMKHDIVLYNFYVEKKKDKKDIIKYDITLLTDVMEGEYTDSIYKQGLQEFLKLRDKYSVFQEYEILNCQYIKPGLSGYYFPRIWKHVVIQEAGKKICPEMEQKFKKYGVERIVNSGFGVYTVFFNNIVYNAIECKNYQQVITKYCLTKLKKKDKHKLIQDIDSIVVFDTITSLDKLNGNLYHYYK